MQQQKPLNSLNNPKGLILGAEQKRVSTLTARVNGKMPIGKKNYDKKARKFCFWQFDHLYLYSASFDAKFILSCCFSLLSKQSQMQIRHVNVITRKKKDALLLYDSGSDYILANTLIFTCVEIEC